MSRREDTAEKFLRKAGKYLQHLREIHVDGEVLRVVFEDGSVAAFSININTGVRESPAEADAWALSYKLRGESPTVTEYRSYYSANAIYKVLHDAVMQHRVDFESGPTFQACGITKQ